MQYRESELFGVGPGGASANFASKWLTFGQSGARPPHSKELN